MAAAILRAPGGPGDIGRERKNAFSQVAGSGPRLRDRSGKVMIGGKQVQTDGAHLLSFDPGTDPKSR